MHTCINPPAIGNSEIPVGLNSDYLLDKNVFITVDGIVIVWWKSHTLCIQCRTIPFARILNWGCCSRSIKHKITHWFPFSPLSWLYHTHFFILHRYVIISWKNIKLNLFCHCEIQDIFMLVKTIFWFISS